MMTYTLFGLVGGLLVAAVWEWRRHWLTAARIERKLDALSRGLDQLRDAILGARPAGTSIELALWETEEERAYDVQLQALALPAITACCQRLGVPLPLWPDRDAARRQYAATHPRPEA